MAGPLTWRNVDIDNGANAAAFGQVAKGFGDSTIQGLSIFSDQMDKQIAREDALRTNKAIAAALRGGPAVSGDPRVDAASLFDITSRDTINKSNLVTAGLTQEGLKTSNAQSILDFSQDPEEFMRAGRESDANLAESKGALAAHEAARARDLFGIELDRENLANTREDRKRAEKNRDDMDFINQTMVKIEQDETNRLLNEAYKNGELQPGEQPSQAMWDQFATKAQAYAQGRSGRTIARTLLSQRPGGYNQAAWEASGFGQLDTRAAALEDQITARQKEDYDKDVKLHGQEAADLIWGNYDRMVAKPDGTLGHGSEEDLKSNAKSYSNAVKYLGNQGVSVDKYGDDEKEAIEKVIEVFPHPSIFVPIIKSYTVNGKLDTKGLVPAVRDGGKAALQNAQLKAAERTEGLSVGNPQTAAGTSGTSKAGRADPNISGGQLASMLQATAGDIMTDEDITGVVQAVNLGSAVAGTNAFDLIRKTLVNVLKNSKKEREAEKK